MGKDKTPRRPLLANGERLKAAATRPRGGRDDKFHPLTTVQAHASLAPQAHAIAAGLGKLSRELVGRHVLFEATLHPNYLAPSNFPSEVLASSGVYVVGARPARGTKRTLKTVIENEATRTLILAASPANVKRFTKQVGQAPTWHNEKQWEELRRFSAMSFPRLSPSSSDGRRILSHPR